ncbi:MAG: UDP-4-amino-4,6-dideoxy-N-acetyl-beta-L-altrosamine transaminase [Bacteroidota bacterium]
MKNSPSVMNKAIPYGRQYISEQDIEAVTEALRADFITQGPRIAAFEQAFAEYVGARYAVALANGTVALHLSTKVLGVGPESKVITTPITFVASANCVRYCGGQVDFVDVDPNTALMDLTALRRKLAAAPKGTYSGVIPVDFAGYPVDTEALRVIADEFGLWIIRDSCHSPGGYFYNQAGAKVACGSGQYADLSIFSFHPVKHIAAGEGGMITTNDTALYEQLLRLRTHGITKAPDQLQDNHGGWYYEMQELGYNYRITDFQAALGHSQLQRAAANLEIRRNLAQSYDEAFAGTAVEPLLVDAEIGHAYHLYVVRVRNRKAVYDHLRAQQIFAQIHYIPVHYQPYYQNLGFQKGDFPFAEAYYAHCLSLPMYPTLTAAEQAFVIRTILEVAE